MDAQQTILDHSRLTIPEHVLARQVGGETVLMNLDNERYYGLDTVGTRLWELIAAETTFGQAVAQLVEEYAVSRETLASDLTVLLLELRENGLVAIDAP